MFTVTANHSLQKKQGFIECHLPPLMKKLEFWKVCTAPKFLKFEQARGFPRHEMAISWIIFC